MLLEDEELKPQGRLWQYLDRIAKEDLSMEDNYSTYGPYQCEISK